MNDERTPASGRAAAERLFREVVAPLTLGGAIHPGPAIAVEELRGLPDQAPPSDGGARGLPDQAPPRDGGTQGLPDEAPPPGGESARAPARGSSSAGHLLAADVADSAGMLRLRVEHARLRRARALVPVDALRPLGAADWALAAAFRDILRSADPAFDALLRRRSAAVALDLANAILDRVSAPTSLGDALARHSWLARILDVRRTDTRVSWWSGSRSFLGRAPPPRIVAWPGVRRVHVARTNAGLFEWGPLAVPASAYAMAIARLLALSPLTDLATCARDGDAPAFAWSTPALALIGSPFGRRLAFRVLALAERDADAVDAALGRATRELVAMRTVAAAGPVLRLLADRALARAMREGLADARLGAVTPAEPRPLGGSATADAPAEPRPLGGSATADARLARALGALAAGENAAAVLLPPGLAWNDDARVRVAASMAASATASPEAQRLLRMA